MKNESKHLLFQNEKSGQIKNATLRERGSEVYSERTLEAAETNTIGSYDSISQEGRIKNGSDISK